MFCTNCGKKLNQEDLFCLNCGHKVEVQKPSQAPASGSNMPPPPPPTYPYTQPPAGPYAGPPPKKKKTGLIIGLVIGALVLIGLIVFLLLMFVWVPKHDRNKIDASRTTSAIEAGLDLPELGLGETGIFEGLAMTIDKVSRPDENYLYSRPSDGNEYILVWYTFKNVSKKKIESPTSIKMYTVKKKDNSPDGRQELTAYDAGADYAADGMYEQHQELAPGEKTSGWLIYQKPIEAPKLTIHYYSRIIGRAPDLAFSFPVTLDPLAPAETGITTLPASEPTSQATSQVTKEPDPENNLESFLPGLWVSLPTSEDYSFVYGFMDGLVCSTFAYSMDHETTLDNWDTPDAWYLDPYIWENWRVEGDDLVISAQMNDFYIKINIISQDEIEMTSVDGTDTYTLYRKGPEPTLEDYLTGIWLPDQADENGVYAALSFYPDGSAMLTGSKKKLDSATADEWPLDEFWETLGEVDGSWRVEENKLIVNMKDSEDVYKVTIYTPNNCILTFGDSWETGYSRVIYGDY
ncbi:MAG: DUF4352 domain-containing protein [Fastidiosipila sp.]|nr:DUF4352 domain-containing protein [Fastidiosipila sp.]